jgi:hypothetical protein
VDGSSKNATAELGRALRFRKREFSTIQREGRLRLGRSGSNFFQLACNLGAAGEILPHAPRGFSPQALGYALPCAKSGMQVTIYADRVETVSWTTLAGFYRVLGHALAHEVGHVLLRSCAHDDSGLMRCLG